MKKEKNNHRDKNITIEKVYNWYDEKGFILVWIIFIILAIILTYFFVVNGFSKLDYSSEYNSMSQAFEENREHIEGLLNPETNISMLIDGDNYMVSSDEKNFINIRVNNSTQYIIDPPSICYPVSINNGEYIISDEYYNSNMSFPIRLTFLIILFMLSTATLLFFFFIINLISLLILEKLINLKNNKEYVNDIY